MLQVVPPPPLPKPQLQLPFFLYTDLTEAEGEVKTFVSVANLSFVSSESRCNHRRKSL